MIKFNQKAWLKPYIDINTKLRGSKRIHKKEDQKEFIKNKKLISKTQQRFRSEKYNLFTEKINKIAFISNDDKRMQSIDSIKTYAPGTSKDLVCKKEEIKCNNIVKQYKND